MSEHEETPLERVYTAAGHLQAHIIKGKLESEGIPAILQGESQMLPFTVDGMGEVRVLVPKPLAEQAREVIARTES